MIFTYEMNILNGTIADTDATRFPAHFSWNMINQAENNGSEAYHGWEVAKRIGIPTAKSYGGLFALDGRMGELKKVTVTIPEGR